MRIAIIAVEGSLLSAITGLADLFWIIWITNQALRSPPEGTVASLPDPDRVSFQTNIVSADGRPLRDPQGRLIPVDGSFHELAECEVAKLPPLSDSIRQAEAALWLQERHKHGVLVGAACAGTFVLGEAGLLDGRRCTTTWWLHHAFKQRFPRAQTVWGTAVEEQDGVITTGGPLSWVDLALHVIRRQAGPAVAKLAADVSVRPGGLSTRPIPCCCRPNRSSATSTRA